jgi:hypothetical protein
VSSLAFRFEGEVALPRLEKWIQQLMSTKAKDLYRYKGVVAVVGMDDQYVLQGVLHELLEGELMSPWAQGQRRISTLVFIGKDLDRELLTTQLNKCKVYPLRFKVGDIVEACVGQDQFEWNDGYPYRMSRLAPKPGGDGDDSDDSDQEPGDMWVPNDTEDFIRARKTEEPGAKRRKHSSHGSKRTFDH